MSTPRQKSWKDSPAIWPLAGIVLLVLVNLVYGRNFFSIKVLDGHYYGTLVDIFNRGSVCMLLALGMTLVIATGGIDLSVGSVMAIIAAVAAMLLQQGHSLVLVILACLAVGVVCGFINGVLVSWASIQPIVATLVLMVAGRGVAQLVTGDFQVPITDSAFSFLGNGYVAGVPFAPVLATALYLAAWLWLRRSATGLFIEAAGDNETASRFAGLATGRVKCLAYVVCGLTAAAAGLFAASYYKTADPFTAGQNMELDAIFAVVVGGTALSGGRFSLLGSYLGALMLQTLTDTMYSVGVPAAVAPVPKAVLIIIVCLLQSETTRRWFGRFRRRAVA